METTLTPPGEQQRSGADAFMRRLLRVEGEPKGRAADADRAFSTSILISATRCVLTYIVLPFVAPILGLAAGVGPAIGIAISSVAIVFNVMSIRRFWRADHRWRWVATIVSTTIIVLLVVLVVRDIANLLG